MRRRSDRGSGTVWVVAFMGVVWAVGVAAIAVGGVRGARARAEAAADFAALAGAGQLGGDGRMCRKARDVAAASGGRLVSCVAHGGIVDVAVAANVRMPLGLGERRIVVRSRAGPVRSDRVP
ncbi:helicase/secretion neighborhood TadE-like protein [Actinomadura rubteroloni]|uniref:Helicase/secretion neighborhood TadE-like protein n=1 Tax=Actinomadura rubteroloni TaxID=1926885 RepID=A0A2P4UN69_9ACTN|nr:Rv3654c family TadE-like protein [Actinomadura rubteroloni]POM26492.1 helicase/secretion neighborhood TadE-like protein [Actinomadura rubteroloni]